MEKHIFLLILVFQVQFYYVSISATSSNETDQEALLAFQNHITSPSNFLANNWTKNTCFCSWFGVTCSEKRQRVVALALANMQLQGTISPSLGNLSFLRELNLENNLFHGGIPYGLGHLPRLRVIDIQNNQLQGSIPTSLFQHQRVQSITLAFNKLSGEMWKGAWYVQELRVLNLRNNSLTGIIPPTIGNATKLMNFSLHGNRINGNIPKEIGNLSQLAELYLSRNQLTGSIPSTLFNISLLLVASMAFNSLSGPLLLDEGNILSNLEHLGMSYNQISGRIPSNICQLKELKVLSISYNKITGEIPKNIGCLAKLEEFYIGYNPINGKIPTSLGNISTLQKLYCGNNRIVGEIPPELGNLSNLREIDFEENYNLIGEIPNAIFNISTLESIAFNLNNLSGKIPDIHLPNLVQLLLANNQLEGEIPRYITNASKLELLELSDNLLTGTIPNNLGNLRELRALFLHHNQLTELRFFDSLANCRMLRYLQVGSNPLNGVLPNSIGNLSSTTEVIHIGDARISGSIPTSTGNMSGLTTLVFQDNNLTGNIPPEIGKLEQLQGLFLINNKLQGNITEVVCHLSNLVRLTLADNELSGVIPKCIGNLSMLQQLYLSSNKFSSKFPYILWKMRGLLYLDVSRNSIEGEVPSDIGELKAIVEIDISDNHFSGLIPSNLGDLQNLKLLSISNNSFSGPIPLSLSNLISLEILDLSVNALSGTIPKSLEKLLYLKAINVSFNNLEGEIPSGGVFANSTLQSFLGNSDLCGMHILGVPACAITTPEQQLKSKELVLKIVTPVVISFFLIFLLVSIWIMKRKKKGKSKDVEKVPEIRTYQLISYHEIQRATNNFDGSNLVGVGGSGSVYKGTLPSGIVVAIKVLDLQNEEILAVSKSMAHTKTLGTLGYIAPEYGSEGIVSTSGDVYSYGIMLMEVLAKRKPTDEEIFNENLGLREWIRRAFPKTTMEVVDANIFHEEEQQITSKSEICIISMIELALDCTKETPESRITMKDDYSEMSLAYRPSHADATYDFKYGVRSVQGGGRSSARGTIGRVAAGAVAKKILKLYSGTEIESNIVQCPNPEYAEKMIAAIDAVRTRGDSVGGVVACIVRNASRGLGTPVFDKLEAELAKACMSLPAIKGFELGGGFAGKESSSCGSVFCIIMLLDDKNSCRNWCYHLYSMGGVQDLYLKPVQ
ncbi:hypothetical protein K7X08_001381 [Anisodus acutangulus]|uniref:Chorismate synthase n=1 Tax=Anisodus acutangulus TaxID=402998 RepID=A0A9Q1RNG8_9SOLA|nr:hypothetical protein K7X08_001381 [Anisodus acutangulus]